MEQYGILASVYDAYMDTVPYRLWQDILAHELQAANIQPGDEVLDMACGTGNIAIALAKLGYHVTAMDISPSMLSVAQQKAREQGVNIDFALADMLHFELPHKVDAITCIFDAVNYLESLEDVDTFIRRAHSYLKPGGLLLFDISTPYHLFDVIGNHAYASDLGVVAYIWSNTTDKTGLQMDLTLFIQQQEDEYFRHEETHILTAHQGKDIAALLDQNGFAHHTLDFMANSEPDEATLRILFVARKGNDNNESSA